MKHSVMRRWLIIIGLALLIPHVAGAQTQQKFVTLGGDLSPEQQTALLGRFGAKRDTDKVQTISTDQMREAMQNIIPIPEGYKSLSSTALTCGAPGSGLRVSSENITKVTAPMYAAALITAGIGDAEFVVAAPQDAPAEGMTALTGMFKTLEGGACGRGEIDVKRRELAYRQLDITSKIANAIGGGDAQSLTKAADFVLRTQQVLVREKNNPNVAVPDVEGVQRDTGVTLPKEQFDQLVQWLATTGQANVDWGTYAPGWELQQVSDTEARVNPKNLGGSAGGAGQAYTGTVGGTNPLRVTVPGAPSRLTLTANNSLRVIRNDKPATLADLQPGDTVTITVGPDNVAQQVVAQSGNSASSGAANRVQGTADNVQGNTITLTTENGKQRFTAGSDITVTRNGKAAKLGDIQPKDSVIVSLDANRQPTLIQANSGGLGSSSLLTGGNLRKYILPLLAALLLLGLLFFLLGGRRRRPRQAVLVEPRRRTVMDTDELEDELDVEL